MSDITDYQLHPNGPLKPDLIEALKIIRAQNNLSYKQLGFQLNISAAFAHNILNKSMNITTNPYMYKIAPGVTLLLKGEIVPMDDVDGAEDMSVVGGENASDALIQHPFMLRKALTISLSLPADLTVKEAERLSLFVRSLPQ